MLKEDMRMG
jgi:hypothetical protein